MDGSRTVAGLSPKSLISMIFLNRVRFVIGGCSVQMVGVVVVEDLLMRFPWFIVLAAITSFVFLEGFCGGLAQFTVLGTLTSSLMEFVVGSLFLDEICCCLRTFR